MIEIKYLDGHVDTKDCSIADWLEEHGYGSKFEYEGYGGWDYLDCLPTCDCPWEKDFGIVEIREPNEYFDEQE